MLEVGLKGVCFVEIKDVFAELVDFGEGGIGAHAVRPYNALRPYVRGGVVGVDDVFDFDEGGAVVGEGVGDWGGAHAVRPYRAGGGACPGVVGFEGSGGEGEAGWEVAVLGEEVVFDELLEGVLVGLGCGERDMGDEGFTHGVTKFAVDYVDQAGFEVGNRDGCRFGHYVLPSSGFGVGLSGQVIEDELVEVAAADAGDAADAEGFEGSGLHPAVDGLGGDFDDFGGFVGAQEGGVWRGRRWGRGWEERNGRGIEGRAGGGRRGGEGEFEVEVVGEFAHGMCSWAGLVGGGVCGSRLGNRGSGAGSGLFVEIAVDNDCQKV